MTVRPDDYKGPTEFVHLHNHTIFSALDGVASPEQYAEECFKRGYPAMAATEHGHMASVPDMHFAFSKRGIKYIPACEIYYNDYEPLRKKRVEQGQKMKRLEEEDVILSQRVRRNRHLTVLAKNEQGFHNLVEITTRAYKFGYYYNPRIWFDKLREYREGLIVLSGCLNGPIGYEVRLDLSHLKEHGERPPREKGRDCTAVEYIKKFKEVFGDDFYLEVQMPCLPELFDYAVFELLLKYADRYDVKAVLTNDCHYLRRDDFKVQTAMMAIAQKKTVDDPELFHVNSDEQYLKTRAELWATFKNNRYSQRVTDERFEQIADNTIDLAKTCETFNPDTNPKIPDWTQVEPGVDASKRLREVAELELKRRGLDKVTERYPVDGREVTYADQMKIELDRFIDKGFASYFLITQDLLSYGRDKGWPFGPRGSAGGSVVCFLLSIHDLDPLKWGLSFDRFMASSRGGYMLNVRM